MAVIPQTKIDEIATAVDIVDVISQYTHLKRSGKNFMGRCPFHEERTPSFSVSLEKGVYHCFGCGKSGNVFNFVMEKQNVTFFEAVKILAERANIPLEFEYREPAERNQIQTLFEIHRKSARFFYDNLTGKSGAAAMEYLSMRGIDEATIKKFGLGYSPPERNGLYKKLKEEYSLEDVLASGLVISLDQGEYKDRFRNRIMFPVFNESGKVVGFGGRRLSDSEDEAKYINSPETRIYNKSRILYGLNFANDFIRKEGYAVLVEGYMDLISLFQNGSCNVVASSGTSLTGLQIKILKRYTNEVVIIFDADTAGKRAAYRGIEIIIENDMNVSIAVLPQGYDPDSYVKKFSKEGFMKIISARKSVINYIAEKFQEENKLTTPEGKTEFVRELIGLIARMRDHIKRDFYIKDISERFSIYETLIRKELEKHISLRRRGLTRQVGADAEPAAPELDVPLIELMLIRILLEPTKPGAEYLMNNLEPELLEDKDVEKIVNYIIQNSYKRERLSHINLMNHFNDDRIKRIISKSLFSELFSGMDLENKEAAIQVLTQLKIIHVNSQINETEERIKSDNVYSKDTLKSMKELEELKKEKIGLEQQLRKKASAETQ
jgi:DNA primase